MKFRNGPIKMPRLEFHLPYNPAAAGLIEGWVDYLTETRNPLSQPVDQEANLSHMNL